jgi:uncharacterized protein YcgL (UPF0745 family)
MEAKTLTVGEKMVEEMQKITEALTKMQGVPNAVIMAYLRQKTNLPKKTIQAVIDGLLELNKEFRK